MSTEFQVALAVQPKKNVLYGITHSTDGTPIIREPRVLKVGIGLPRGKAIDVFVDGDGKWNIRAGTLSGEKLDFKTVAKVGTREQAEEEFRKAWKTAALCGYPRKVPYFVFTRPVMGDKGEEIYVPDFQATEIYSFANPNKPGAPTEIDVIFLDDEPFNGSFAMWSSSELRCSGDGINAQRSVLMYADEKKVPEDLRAVWKSSKEAGERTFLVSNGCSTCNCPFAKEAGGKPPACKPSGDLKFQLARTIRIGGTAFFHTSGYRSIVQIFSAVERIKGLTGGKVAGIPLKLVLRSHKTNHNGQAAVQQNVSIEFRAEDMEDVRKNLIEQAWKFRNAAGLSSPPPAKMIEAAGDLEDFGEVSPLSAKAMAGEFYADNEGDDDTAPVEQAQAATASTAKIASIGQQLKTGAAIQATPWSDRKTMVAAFVGASTRVGKQEYERVLSEYDLTPSTADPAEEKTLACYAAMEKLPAAANSAAF